ncbi:MFS transporter [Kocuria sp.]|uniref:MFS transporter n=1 Tax=Kocuria sp. TaxID=1871328 RepID=UPI0026DFE8C7|nr:MFS transporter [Kocuria sp.]MDO5618240.1 MFS transporter [Kocuria sp.]
MSHPVESARTAEAEAPSVMIEVSPQQRRRAFIGATVGHLIEWYDYGIFGFLAVYVGANFFISEDPLVGILSAFAVFALSFFIRPLGGLFFGPLADKIGRRSTLLIVLTMMCGATMLIGMLPTAHAIGVAAPALLVLLRLVQGFSAGGEVSTITAFIAEYAKKGSRGLATSFLMTTAASGLLIGAVVGNGMTWALGAQTMTDWGWRIPFLLAGPLGAVAIFIRLKLEDSPQFKALQKENKLSKAPLREVLRYPRQLLLTASVIALLASSFYLVLTYMTTYLATILEMQPGITFTYVLVAGGIGAALMPVGGLITDRMGDRRIFLIGVTIYFTAAVVWFFYTAPTASPAGLLLPLIAVAIGFGLYCGVPYAIMSELLPTRVRSTGIALGYNIPVALFGGTAPFIASWLIANTGNVSSPAWFFAVTAAVSLLGLLFMRKSDLLGAREANETLHKMDMTALSR